MLPSELQYLIYSYDPTYREIYNDVLYQLVSKEKRIVQTAIDDLDLLWQLRYGNVWYSITEDYGAYIVKFANGKIGKFYIITEAEAKIQLKEHIKEKIHLFVAEFLFYHTGLTETAIETWQENLSENDCWKNIFACIKDWNHCLEDAIAQYGLENLLNFMMPNFTTSYVKYKNQAYYTLLKS
jgi:hypothetical protein